MKPIVERVYESAIRIVAAKGLQYPAKDIIEKSVGIAIAVEQAVMARADDIEALDDLFADKSKRAKKPRELPVPSPEAGTIDLIAKRAFEAYNAQGPNAGKTHDGRDVPPWENLGSQVREKWVAAVKEASGKKELPRAKVLKVDAPDAEAAKVEVLPAPVAASVKEIVERPTKKRPEAEPAKAEAKSEVEK